MPAGAAASAWAQQLWLLLGDDKRPQHEPTARGDATSWLLTKIYPLLRLTPCRYPVRMALIELDAPPSWFVAQQAADHLTADEARAFAGTDGGGAGTGTLSADCLVLHYTGRAVMLPCAAVHSSRRGAPA